MIRPLTFALMIFALSACGNPPYDGEKQQRHAHMDQSFQSVLYKDNGKTVHAVTTGKSCNPAIIFIHGAPGDWKAWGRYLGDTDLRKKAFMIAVDRPGFAQSNYGVSDISLRSQSDQIINAALQIHDGPFLVVGHSYGGPVQMQMAIDHAQHLSANILLAGAIDPALHKARWYHYAASVPPARWMLSKPFKVTTDEMMGLHKELLSQADALATVEVPTKIIQGGKDWLVPPANAQFAKTAMKAADVEIISLPEQGHFIPWKEFALVKSTILKTLPSTNICSD